MVRAATFDPALEEEVGHTVGREVRAFGGKRFAGLCINLPYNPGWGRSQETYGEETMQIGAMGAALVRGVQSEDVMACVKHFAFSNMENARFTVSVPCDQRTGKEVMLPHFKDCPDAGAASIMSSYNRYNGTCCGHHHYLLTEILKGERDFDGFVISDFIPGAGSLHRYPAGGLEESPSGLSERFRRRIRSGSGREPPADAVVLIGGNTIMMTEWYDPAHRQWKLEKTEYTVYTGSSEALEDLQSATICLG